MKFKVTPTHKYGYTTPYFVEEVEKNCDNPEGRAIEQAKKRSRLADFPDSWQFFAVRIY